jgi:hypothetical protein
MDIRRAGDRPMDAAAVTTNDDAVDVLDHVVHSPSR